MGGRWLSRLSIAAAGGALALIAAAPAWATPDTSEIPLNSGQVGTFAADYAVTGSDCANEAFTRYLSNGDNVWVFVWPATTTDIDTLTLTFDTTGGNTANLTLHKADGVDYLNGVRKFWVAVPVGSRILYGDSYVFNPVGTDKFNVTHTCLATQPSPSPSVSQSQSPGPSPSVSQSQSPSPSPSVSQSQSPSPSPSPSPSISVTGSPSPSSSVSTSPSTPVVAPSSPSPGPSLPVTGAPLAIILGAGGLLLAAGTVLLLIRRRGINFTS